MSGLVPILASIPSTRIGFIDDALVKHEDMVSEQVSNLTEVGVGIIMAQGARSAVPIANSIIPPLAVTTNGTMVVSVGGSGQGVFVLGVPCDGTSAQSFTVPNNTSGQTRVDIIEIQPAWSPSGNTIPRPTFNNGPTVNEPLNWKGLNYKYKNGTPGGGAPSPDAGYVAFATITVPNGAAAINASNVAVLLPTMNPQGAAGQNAWTTTTAAVAIPSVGSNVTLAVVNNTTLPAGQYCYASDGTHNFYGLVISTTGATSMVVQVKAIGTGGTLASGAIVAPAGQPGTAGATGATGATGAPGANGSNGHGATTTTASATVPAVGSSTTLPVSDGTAFPNGTMGLASDGTHAFAFVVTAGGGTSSLTVMCTNVTAGASGATLANGATVTFSGLPAGVASILTAAGALLSNSPKLVIGTVLISAGTTSTPVGLTGNAIFTGSGTYFVFTQPYQNTLPSSAVSYFITNNSGSQFTIINGSISSNINLAWVAIGY